jgi:hypothetical protein
MALPLASCTVGVEVIDWVLAGWEWTVAVEFGSGRLEGQSEELKEL